MSTIRIKSVIGNIQSTSDSSRSVEDISLSYKNEIQNRASKLLVSNELRILQINLHYILNNNVSSEVLELFLKGLKKVTSDIQLPNLPGNNPLNTCLGSSDGNKLAVFLSYGANPNRNFYLKNTSSWDIPPILIALFDNIQSDIRLLALFGADYNQAIKMICKLTREYQIIFNERLQSESYKNGLIYFDEVKKEIDALHEIEAKAQTAERLTAKNYSQFKSAYICHYQVGNLYLSMSDKCQNECESEESKKTLPIFYMRRALPSYERSLYCLQRYAQEFPTYIKTDLTSWNEFKLIQKSFQENYAIVLNKCNPLSLHPLHHDKMDTLKDKITLAKSAFQDALSDMPIEQQIADTEEADNAKYGMHRRLLASSPTNTRTSDSSEDNKYLPSSRSFS
jgi:hypothetical protein